MTSDIVPTISSENRTLGYGIFSHAREPWKLGDDCSDETQMWNHDQLNNDDQNPMIIKVILGNIQSL